MSSKLSDFVNLSSFEATIAVLLGRWRAPVDPADDAFADRIEPRLGDERPGATAADSGTAGLPYLADLEPVPAPGPGAEPGRLATATSLAAVDPAGRAASPGARAANRATVADLVDD